MGFRSENKFTQLVLLREVMSNKNSAHLTVPLAALQQCLLLSYSIYCIEGRCFCIPR